MYDPQKSLLEGLRRMAPVQMFPWDDYFPFMAQTDFLRGDGGATAVKSFFIRKAPFGGSFALLGGITAALRGITDLRFDDPDFARGMLEMGYKQEFIKFLAKKRGLQIRVFAPDEGAVFYPGEPIISIVGPLPDVRLAEGIITEAVNFPSLSLTKWNRLVRVTRPSTVLEFARRRAQDAFRSTLYAMLAGCGKTSHSEIRRHFDFPVSGTMGHEWIQRFGDVVEAFRIWLELNPGRPVGLVDTKQCLEYDFPAWLDQVYEHREAIKKANPPFWGWRNDSGDLAVLSIEQYARFLLHPLAGDSWFVERLRIVLTNDLDEYAAEAIIQQIYSQAKAAGLPADDLIRRLIWAAGTKPGTCDDQPSIGGVMKLVEVENQPCIKLAFDANGNAGIKTSIPGFNRSVLILDSGGKLVMVLVFPYCRYHVYKGKLLDLKRNRIVEEIDARHPDNPGERIRMSNYTAIEQQQLVYDSLYEGGFTPEWANPMIMDVPARIDAGLARLSWQHTRLAKPQTISLMLTADLYALRLAMIKYGALRRDKLPADVLEELD